MGDTLGVMPWKETSLVEERKKFIEDWLTSHTEVSGLCRVYGISRKSGYKWIDRFKMAGLPGLEDRSHATRRHPNEVPEQIRELLIQSRKQHPSWGPKKLRAWLEPRHPNVQLPAASTIGDILQRAGLVTARSRRRRLVGQQGLVTPAQEANQVWSTDYKGQFRLGNGRYCYPLTVTDDFSRFVLGCDAHQRTTAQNARKSFEKLFHCYGLPDAMRSDNGTPFASVGAGRLTRLSAWWLKLGIRLERITPGRPQENGRHERMHRTLKAETTRPPSASHAGQQRRFDTWRNEYNQERPHEALEQSTPTQFYCSSGRPYPKQVPSPEYPGHYEVRRVRHDGSIRFRGLEMFLSEALSREPVGLYEVDDGLWRICFCSLDLAVFDERAGELRRLGGSPRASSKGKPYKL